MTFRTIIAACLVLLSSNVFTRADDKETLMLLITNGGAIIGQSIACNISQDRLLKVMVAQAAAVQTLSNGDTRVMKLRDDTIRQAVANERSLGAQRCGTIETALSKFEQTLKNHGILK